MILPAFSLRSLRRRPVRTAVTLSGTVIGVAAILAIMISIRTTRHTYTEMFDRVAGRAALEVHADGLGNFDPRPFEWLGSVSGVASVVPLVQRPAALLRPGGPLLVMTLGIDPARDAVARPVRLASGRPLDSGAEALLEQSFARSHEIRTGDDVSLITRLGPTSCRVVGLLESEGVAAFNGGAVVFLPLDLARRAFGVPAQHVNALQIVLQESAHAATVRDTIRERLPAGHTVDEPLARGALGQEVLAGTEQGLAVLSLVSLVAGAFVILNTFLMSLHERRREFALLRTLGATRRQLTRWLLAEALLLGGLGTVVGLLAGVVLAVGMNAAIGEGLGLTLPSLRWSVGPFLVAGALGPLMALAATVLPARMASREPPLEGLVDHNRYRPATLRRWPAVVGAVLAAVCVGIEIGYVNDAFAPALRDALLAPAMMLFLIGSVLLFPLLLPGLARLSRWFPGRLLGTEGMLALRQLVRHPQRSVLTVGVLYTAIVVAIGMGNSLLNNVDDVRDWFGRTLTADYYLRGAFPDRGVILAPIVPADAEAAVAELGGVAHVEPVSFLRARTGNGDPLLVLARRFPADGPLPIDLADGDPTNTLAALLSGEAVIGTVLARRLGLAPGDRLEIATPTGPRAVRIAATATMYTVGGIAITMHWPHASALLGNDEVHVLAVYAHPEQRTALAQRLATVAAEHGLAVQSLAEFRTLVDDVMEQIVGSLWGLIALVFVVASLGVVNTLTMNVLDQVREIGVLRAIAMRRSQVARLIIAQALHLSAMSFLPGLVIGVLLAYLMSLANEPVSGYAVDFRLEPGLVATCLGVAVIVSLLAALIPARRAARLEITRALKYE